MNTETVGKLVFELTNFKIQDMPGSGGACL